MTNGVIGITLHGCAKDKLEDMDVSLNFALFPSGATTYFHMVKCGKSTWQKFKHDEPNERYGYDLSTNTHKFTVG